MQYSNLTSADVDAAASLERSFFVPRGLPPESRVGALAFLAWGGSIIGAWRQENLMGAFWLIKLAHLPSAVPRRLAKSGLGIVCSLDLVRELPRSAFFVYSWAGGGMAGSLLWRHVRRWAEAAIPGEEVYGFAATESQSVIRCYRRIGCVPIRHLPRLYGEHDSHMLLRYVVAVDDSPRLTTVDGDVKRAKWANGIEMLASGPR